MPLEEGCSFIIMEQKLTNFLVPDVLGVEATLLSFQYVEVAVPLFDVGLGEGHGVNPLYGGHPADTAVIPTSHQA